MCFSIGEGRSQAVALDAGGRAQLRATDLGAGSVAVTATYEGDDNFAPGAAALTQVVRVPTSTSPSCLPNPPGRPKDSDRAAAIGRTLRASGGGRERSDC